MIDFKKNYFELFELKLSMNIDLEALTHRYQTLQKKYHPDANSNSTVAQQRVVIQASTHINNAFNTLKNPMARAAYLLSLHGVDVNNDTDTQMEMSFLIQQMQWREQLESLPTDDNAWEAIDALTETVNQTNKTLLSQCHDLAEAAEWQTLRETVRKLQFIDKMLKEIDEKSQKIEDSI